MEIISSYGRHKARIVNNSYLQNSQSFSYMIFVSLKKNLGPVSSKNNVFPVCFSFFYVFVLQDKDRVELFLAAAHMGVLVFQNGSKINAFSW